MVEVNRLLEDPQAWSDPKRAQELGREKKALEGTVGTLASIERGLKDAAELYQLGEAEKDDATLEGVAKDAAALEQDVHQLEFRRMFSNPLDANGCFIDIQAGSGGTGAQDWAAMLERMYLKFCDRKDYKV
ncbi:MAG: PCRF domain-containing protein, partial [Burkholderiales bacterium]